MFQGAGVRVNLIDGQSLIKFLRLLYLCMKKQQSVTLCGETLTGPRHICAFFDSRKEEYEMRRPKRPLINNN